MHGPLSIGYSQSLQSDGRFPSPFLDMASTAMPEDMRTALEYCEFLFQSEGTYRQAMERIIAYFNTDIDVGSPTDTVGDDEKAKWHELTTTQLDLRAIELEADRDLMCYGNCFLTVVVPFQRFMVCPKCHLRMVLGEVFKNPIFRFKFVNFEFTAHCPKCRFQGSWRIHDEPQQRADKLRIKRWSPHQIHLMHDMTTDEVKFLWKIPEDYKQQLRQGKLFNLERVSLQVLQAIKKNQLFMFDDGMMYHMKEPTLAGIQNRGWGVSRIIWNFRQIWYVKVLHRFNEALALDYVIPFRVVTPTMRTGSQGQATDILLNANMGDQMSQIRRMIRARRRNPAMWHTLGFPVEYKVLGGDANQLAPHELLAQGLDTMLNAAGTPVELYKGTMQLQVAPAALRLFEATWHHLVHQNNAFLRWVGERVSEIMGWEAVVLRHRRVTHADDMQRHMAVLQLAMGGQVSLTTALRSLGLEYRDEQRNIIEEARFQQEEQAEVQEEMEQSAFGQQMSKGAPAGAAPGGAMPGGAAPGAAGAGAGIGGQQAAGVDPTTGMPITAGPVTQMISGGNMPTTPEEMMSQASAIAQQLLGLPESLKDSELRALKQKNETMHALVRAELDKIRGQARTQGGAMLMSQTFGG